MITKTGIEYSENSDLSNSSTIEENGTVSSITIPDWEVGVDLYCQAYVIDDGDRINSTIEHYVDSQSPDYVCISNVSGTNNTFTFTTRKSGNPVAGTYASSIEYSKDGNTWSTLNFNTSTPQDITLQSGENLYLRNDTGVFNHWDLSKYYVTTITATHNHTISGDIMSLLDYTGTDTTLKTGCFYNLFDSNHGLIYAYNLTMPDTVAERCYAGMFQGCSSMTVPPEELPALTLADSCYKNMFTGCSALTQAPDLPARTLAPDCYALMFSNCRSIESIPQLQATTLSSGCYYNMFYGCSAITEVELPARTLVQQCYYGMFDSCTSLNTVKVYARDISASYCTEDWLKNVAQSGTFYNYNNANFSRGEDGIPTGWTILYS